MKKYQNINFTMSPKYVLAPPMYSNPRNNHDDQKIKYKTRKDAEKVMRRMIRQGCNGWERLNVYKNKKLGTWHVGRSNC